MTTVILGGLVALTLFNLLVLPTHALRYGISEPRPAVVARRLMMNRIECILSAFVVEGLFVAARCVLFELTVK
jgi:hypothetical protein